MQVERGKIVGGKEKGGEKIVAGTRAQTAVEYLLLVVAAVVIVTIIAYFIKTKILS